MSGKYKPPPHTHTRTHTHTHTQKHTLTHTHTHTHTRTHTLRHSHSHTHTHTHTQVLQTLLKQLTVGSRDRMSLLNDARHLFENSDPCSLTISKSNVDDACLSLELLLESYWAATQSVVLMDTFKPSHASATEL